VTESVDNLKLADLKLEESQETIIEDAPTTPSDIPVRHPTFFIGKEEIHEEPGPTEKPASPCDSAEPVALERVDLPVEEQKVSVKKTPFYSSLTAKKNNLVFVKCMSFTSK
jgi:hypothetical protein